MVFSINNSGRLGRAYYMASAFYASFCGSRLSASILFIPVSTVQMKIELVVDTLLGHERV